MKKEKIEQLDFSDEFLLDSVERRMDNGDFLGALTMLNKRNSLYEPSADACAFAANIYEEMGLWQLAADSWFRFLDTCNEADFAEGYEGLAVCFMNMGDSFRSAYYFHQSYGQNARGGEDGEDDPDGVSDIADFGGVRDLEEAATEMLSEAETASRPKLRIVDDAEDDVELLERGLCLLKSGDLKGAKKTLSEVSAQSPEYASAMGLFAMCMLLLGDDEGAGHVCEELLEKYPDNVQALTTYCAVLGAGGREKEAKEVALRLARVATDSTEDLYRIASALCETGLDEEAYQKISKLIKKIPYDDTMLYFYAVSAYRTGRVDEAIEALERLTTVFPRKAVANYYLGKLRAYRDGGEKFPMNYYYRLPKDEYNRIADFFLSILNDEDAEIVGAVRRADIAETLRIAFDEMDGRDEKLQAIAVKVAVRTRSDAFLREILLDGSVEESVKLDILHDLTMRNEDDSFGTVVLNLYSEFYTHELQIGRRGREVFLRAFADVYSRFSLVNRGNGIRIIAAAEDIYASLAEYGAYDLLEERESLACAIYREARIPSAEHSFERIVELFKANRDTVISILYYMM